MSIEGQRASAVIFLRGFCVNIATALERQCQQRPDAVAIAAPTSQTVKGERVYTSVRFGELGQRIARLTSALGEIGIQPGDRCALMVPPSIEFVELTFALFACGAVPVFVDPGIGLGNLKACLGEAEPSAFVGITKAHVARILFGWAKPSLKTCVTVGRRLGWGGWTLQQLRAASDSTCGIAPTQPDDVAAILFTSGSTGVPKGAVYTHGMFTAQLESLQRAFAIEPGEVDLCTFPLFALFGPALGMTSVIPVMDATKPALVDYREIVGPIRRFSATNLFGSPALLNRVGRECQVVMNRSTTDSVQTEAGLPDVGLPTLKRVLSAGAPVSPTILQQFQSLLSPGVQIFTPYGATESLPVAVIGSETILSETRHQTEAGAGTCVGRPVDGLDVRIIRISDDPIATWSDDLLLPSGEIGEIAVYGPQVTQEYFRRPELTALAKIPDPARGRCWHRMGDVGYFDATGRLWFCGRKSQRVVTPDGTWFTDRVEGVFNSHPAVFRTALVGVKYRGEMTPVLCVELEPALTRPDRSKIVAELRALAADHAVTRGLDQFLFHPKFPVDIRHNSKIFREKLAVWASRQRPFAG